MFPPRTILNAPASRRTGRLVAQCALSLLGALSLQAQKAATPAGVESPLPSAPVTSTAQPDLPARDLRQAEDAYLRGARALDHKDLTAAEHEFLHATQLNPRNREYAIALAVTREHRLTDLVQRAARAEKLGRQGEAERLLQEARALDPDNAVVRQHFTVDGQLTPFGTLPATVTDTTDPIRAMRAADANSLAGPIQLKPSAGPTSIHVRGTDQDILRALCGAFGLRAQFDASVTGGRVDRLDLDNVSFDEASRTAQTLTHTFLVPLQPGAAFFAKDTAENRAQFEPLVEETLFIPGTTSETLTEYAALARSIFNLKVVNAVNASGGLVLRGDPGTLDRVNATFSDLIDGGSDILLDVTLYEVDTDRTRTLGASTPASVGVFPVAAEAESLINSNQSIINAAVANNLITLTGNSYTDALTELEFLIASGTVSSSQFTNLLGVLGHYGGLPLAGVYLGSGSTFNALLSSSDVRVLDTIQLRARQGADASFRAGTRYPIETGIYSSNASSLASSATAGLSINGTSVSSLLSQYLGSSNVSVPQIQYEDLGLTLKATPLVQRAEDVSLKLDLKIEALGSGTINTLPILNNRQLTSEVTIPAGQTVLLASLIDTSEQRSIDGLPFLSELPGFQGTEKSTEVSKTELLITLTPHVVRNRRLQVASRRLLLPLESIDRQGGFSFAPAPEPTPPQPEPSPAAPAGQPPATSQPTPPASSPFSNTPFGQPQ